VVFRMNRLIILISAQKYRLILSFLYTKEYNNRGQLVVFQGFPWAGSPAK
jgi:hypothetical protein